MEHDLQAHLSVKLELNEDGKPRAACRCQFESVNDALTAWLSLTHTLAQSLGSSMVSLGNLASYGDFDGNIINKTFIDVGGLLDQEENDEH